MFYERTDMYVQAFNLRYSRLSLELSTNDMLIQADVARHQHLQQHQTETQTPLSQIYIQCREQNQST